MLPFWPGQQVGADFGCLFILFCDLLFVWSLSFFDIFGKSASRYSTMVSHCSDWQFFTSFLTLVNYFRDILEPTVTPEESDGTPIFPPMPESQPLHDQGSSLQPQPAVTLTNGTQSTSSQEG